MDALFQQSEIGRSPQDLTIQKIMAEAAALYKDCGKRLQYLSYYDLPFHFVTASIDEAWEALAGRAAGVGEGAVKLVRYWEHRYLHTNWG